MWRRTDTSQKIGIGLRRPSLLVSPPIVSSSMRGIRDLISRDAPPLPRAAPNFGDAQVVDPDADSLLRVAADLVNSPDQVHVSGDIRPPPVVPEQPPPVFRPSDQENAQTTEIPSGCQSDWYAG